MWCPMFVIHSEGEPWALWVQAYFGNLVRHSEREIHCLKIKIKKGEDIVQRKDIGFSPQYSKQMKKDNSLVFVNMSNRKITQENVEFLLTKIWN